MAYFKELVEFGQRVKAERMQQRIEPAGLARLMRVPVERVYAIERGEDPALRLTEVIAVCRALHVPISKLVTPRSYQGTEYRH